MTKKPTRRLRRQLRVTLPDRVDEPLHMVAARRKVPVHVVVLEAVDEHLAAEAWLKLVPADGPENDR